MIPLVWAILPVIALVAFTAYKTIIASDPLHYMYPNFLMFTPFRKDLTNIWPKYVKYDTSITFEPAQIPSIDSNLFSMESLAKATEGWKYPAVIRGIFKNSTAVEKWGDPNYLSSKIGDFLVPVVRTAIYGTLQNDRTVMTFRDAFTEIVTNSTSKMYLFFPVRSRFNFNHSELGVLKALESSINKVVLEDLEINTRIWNGFGTEKHSTYFGAQLIVGQGAKDSEITTGTGWHCAAGNNWFAQVSSARKSCDLIN
jgi:hypothetical protein